MDVSAGDEKEPRPAAVGGIDIIECGALSEQVGQGFLDRGDLVAPQRDAGILAAATMCLRKHVLSGGVFVYTEKVAQPRDVAGAGTLMARDLAADLGQLPVSLACQLAQRVGDGGGGHTSGSPILCSPF